jgi:hypothetical protein
VTGAAAGGGGVVGALLGLVRSVSRKAASETAEGALTEAYKQGSSYSFEQPPFT